MTAGSFSARCWSGWRAASTRTPFDRLVAETFPLEDITRAFDAADWAASQGHVGRSVVLL